MNIDKKMLNSLLSYLTNLSELPLLMTSQSGELIWSNKLFQNLFSTNQIEALKLIYASKLSSNQELKINGEAFRLNFMEISLTENEKVFFQTKNDQVDIYSFQVIQQTNNSINESLSIVLHDLKNPLGAIFGYSEALLENSNDSSTLSARQSNIINRIRSASSRTLELIKNFQMLSQIEKYPRVSEAFADLNYIIDDVVTHSFRENINEPKITLNLDKLIDHVKIDKFSLERVVANLLNNALKFTPGIGEIKIKTYANENVIFFEINNSPAFIPEDEQKSIFDKYKRGSNSQGTSGSGLGLYIIKEILKANGATIRLSSDRNNGTTITLSFLPK